MNAPAFLYRYLHKVVGNCRQLRHRDEGMMSISNAILLMGSALLLVANFNMAMVTNRKVEVQNAADAVAQAGGIVMARGMNSITATNHVMGEMLSFVILHEALGGKKHERNQSADEGLNKSTIGGGDAMNAPPSVLKNADRELTLAYRAAVAFKGALQFPPHDQKPLEVYQLVHERSGGRTGIHAEATMLDSKLNLKKWLTRVYAGKAAAGALISTGFAPLVAAGRALEAAMEPLELKIGQEYGTLNAVHAVATSLLPVKKLLRDVLLPEAKRHTTKVVKSTPLIALGIARQIGQLNGVDAELFPLPEGLQLPVVMDPMALAQTIPNVSKEVPEPNPRGCGCPSDQATNVRDQIVKVSQLTRATFPWVNYHRQPVLDAFGSALQFAKSKDLYFHWTNGYSKSILDEQQQGEANDPDSHLGLYVMKGTEGPDKGYELWNLAEHSDLADDLFTVIGLAHRGPPTVSGQPIFRQEHPDGMAAYAMAMLYNGNEQQRPEHRIDMTCKRILPIRQANVGMDTLNWKPGSLQSKVGCEERPSGTRPGENRPFELLGIGIPAEYPEIQVNWQSKLVPATAYRLSQLQKAPLPGAFGSIMQRMPGEFPKALATH